MAESTKTNTKPEPKIKVKKGFTAIGLIPVGFLACIVVLSGLFAFVPAFYNENQKFRAQFYEDRTIFTTYFYWYQRGNNANLTGNSHVAEVWGQKQIDDVNAKEWAEGWPGPTRAEDMIFEIDGITWHDSISHHPPNQQPIYNLDGTVAGDLVMGNVSAMSDWYDWMNPGWHEWELRCMMRAGIDVLMPVYWWNGQQNYWALEGLQTLVSTWHTLSATLDLPKIAMFYDTTCMKQLFCWNKTLQAGGEYDNFTDCWDNSPGPNLSDPYWQDEFWKRIDDFYNVTDSIDPASVYTSNGNNVVWLYSGGWFEDVGTEVLDYCKTKFQEKYGRSLYFVGGGEWRKAKVDGICGWGACCPGPVEVDGQGIPVGGIGPGYYNLGAIAIQPSIYHPRDEAAFKANWQTLIDQGAAWIHLETWNELHEGTDSAWSQEYGYQWVDATREMADKFHALDGIIPKPLLSPWEFVLPFAGLMVLSAIGIVSLRKKDSKTATD